MTQNCRKMEIPEMAIARALCGNIFRFTTQTEELVKRDTDGGEFLDVN